jgi:hypothetical protein
MNNYGFGFRMKIFDNGEKLTYHNGWWHGTNSVFAHLLNLKLPLLLSEINIQQSIYSFGFIGIIRRFSASERQTSQRNER